MSAAPPAQHRAEGRTVLLVVWLLLMLLASAFTLAMWFASPLALGFSRPPGDSQPSAAVERLFRLSWFVGLPLLAAGQIASVVLAFRRLPAAVALSTAVLAAFLLMIGLILYMW